MDGTEPTAVVDPPVNASLIDKLFSNELSEAEALDFADSDPACTAFTLLALQQRIAQLSQAAGPNTPSSTIPPYEKPAAKPKTPKGKKQKRGGQPGHAGRTRPPLAEPDRTREHTVLMSVLRTLRVRGHQPLDTILAALASYAKTGVMPPLPQRAE